MKAVGKTNPWLSVWLSALAPVYVISPLSLFALPRLRVLHPVLQGLLGIFAMTQIIPALFTDDPSLNFLLASIRVLLMLGLMSVGASFGTTRKLTPVGIGLGIVYATALLFSFGNQALTGPLGQRLFHPYMTSITVGLIGAVGLWLSLFASLKCGWRWLIGLSGVMVLVLSGSRSAVFAALLGCVVGWITQNNAHKLVKSLLAGVFVVCGTVMLGQRQEIAPVLRFSNTDTSGRDLIWNDAFSVISSSPVFGIGMYRIGAKLTPPGRPCTMWITQNNSAVVCPEWITKLKNPWVIAHNVTVQQLAETGPLGLFGLFILLGVGLVGAFTLRDPLASAILSGILLSTVTDNTLLVPGAFLGELFWITMGTVLVRLNANSAALNWPAAFMAAILTITLSAPVFMRFLPLPVSYTNVISAFIAPREVEGNDYNVHIRLSPPPGFYRGVLRVCQVSCVTIDSQPFIVTESKSMTVIHLGGKIFNNPSQRLELMLYPGASTWQSRPLSIYTWLVRSK